MLELKNPELTDSEISWWEILIRLNYFTTLQFEIGQIDCYKMKHLIFLLLYLFLGQFKFAEGQNIIANPSFETFTACPNNINQIVNAPPWQRLTSSHVPPTYFNFCATNPKASVPVNGDSLQGYQYARTGNSYVGFNFYLTILEPSGNSLRHLDSEAP